MLIAGICDPQAFAVCRAHREGDVFDLSIGMDIDEVTRPVQVRAVCRGCRSVRLPDRLRAPIKRCEAVIVSVGGVDVVITDGPTRSRRR